MPAPSSGPPDLDLIVRQKRGRLGLRSAAGAPPEEIEAAKAELAEAVFEARITKLLESAPPLTSEKKARLAALLGGDQ